jgi:hypothetical protein
MNTPCLKCSTPLTITSSVYTECRVCGSKYKINGAGTIEEQDCKSCNSHVDEIVCGECRYGE